MKKQCLNCLRFDPNTISTSDARAVALNHESISLSCQKSKYLEYIRNGTEYQFTLGDLSCQSAPQTIPLIKMHSVVFISGPPIVYGVNTR